MSVHKVLTKKSASWCKTVHFVYSYIYFVINIQYVMLKSNTDNMVSEKDMFKTSHASWDYTLWVEHGVI